MGRFRKWIIVKLVKQGQWIIVNKSNNRIESKIFYATVIVDQDDKLIDRF